MTDTSDIRYLTDHYDEKIDAINALGAPLNFVFITDMHNGLGRARIPGGGDREYGLAADHIRSIQYILDRCPGISCVVNGGDIGNDYWPDAAGIRSTYRETMDALYALSVPVHCCIGNHCIIVSYVGLAGETDVEDWGIVGGKCGSHQFSRVGTHAFVAAVTKIMKDVPPYVLAGREPICFEGVNRTGLLRRGFTEEQVNEIKSIYDAIYFQGMNVSQAVEYIEANFPATEIRDNILGFIHKSSRGIVPKPKPGR